jgi:hypothetical protein
VYCATVVFSPAGIRCKVASLNSRLHLIALSPVVPVRNAGTVTGFGARLAQLRKAAGDVPRSKVSSISCLSAAASLFQA